MPWRPNPSNPKEVQKKVNGKWVHHATASSPAKAKSMIRLLYGTKGNLKPRAKKR